MSLAVTTRGNGPDLVLLMGLGAPAALWEPHVGAWERSFRCILVDNPGAGSSAPAAGVDSTAAIASCVLETLDAIGVRSAGFAGISMGAATALEIAIQRPALVDRLALIAPWGSCDAATRSELAVLREVRALGAPRPFNELLRNQVWTPEWINQHAEEMNDQLDAPFSMSGDTFAQQIAACSTVDLLGAAAEVVAPALITYGERDRFIRPELSLALAARLPHATTHAFSTGHVHHWEELADFNPVLERWFA